MSEVAAYQQGLWDAVDYEACNPDSYGCIEQSEIDGYYEGYGDGMDVNLQEENGVHSGSPSSQSTIN